MAEKARDEMVVETLDAVADRGYYDSEEIRACEESGITVTYPAKGATSRQSGLFSQCTYAGTFHPVLRFGQSGTQEQSTTPWQPRVRVRFDNSLSGWIWQNVLIPA
jgi:hypothetical protein